MRRKARTSLIAFTEATLPKYRAAPHHRKIAEALEAVERGEIKRLMVFMPPRHGKSELASRRFPAWFMGKNPTKDVITTSYGGELAGAFGREVRNIVSMERYERIFPGVTLAADSKAANHWHIVGSGDEGKLIEQGGYVAAGVGGPITGRGGSLLLIDDPFKDRESADSETVREKAWDWYTSTAYTRLTDDGAIVLIQTRWHEDDLAGRLLEAEKAGGDQWVKVDLPAINEAGEPLWPESFSLERLNQIKSVIGRRDWGALYQQKPTQEEGDYFKGSDFSEYEELPPGVEIYGASDYAVTEERKADYTEHGVAAWSGEDLYIVDWWREQTTPDKWFESQCDLIVEHEPRTWFGESGVIKNAVFPFLRKRMGEREAYCRLEWLPSISSKEIRARPFQALVSSGRVHLPKNAPWKDDLLDQLVKFPTGRHDDGVDVCSLFGRGLKLMGKPKRKFSKRLNEGPRGPQSWMSA